jgi:hypothetical protein
MYRKTTMGLLLTAILCIQGVKAQYYAVSTNLAGWATTNLNLEASVSLSRRVSLHLPVQYNPFVFSAGRRFQNLTLAPGLRYWFEGLHRKGFAGVHLLASRYHAGNLWDKFRYDGRALGAGLSLGYAYPLGERWRFEWEAGGGMLRADHDKYRCKPCGAFLGHESGFYFVPTRVAANMVYQF